MTIYTIAIFISDIDVGALIIGNKFDGELSAGASFMLIVIFILGSIEIIYFISSIVRYYIFLKIIILNILKIM